MLRVHQIVTLLPLFLYVTQQQLGAVPVISQIPFVTLPLIGVIVVALYGYQQRDQGYALKLVLVALAFMAIPIALATLISGGGPTMIVEQLVQTLVGVTL